MGLSYFSNHEPVTQEEYTTLLLAVHTPYEEDEPISISRFREKLDQAQEAHEATKDRRSPFIYPTLIFLGFKFRGVK